MARPRKNDEVKKKLGTFQPCRVKTVLSHSTGFTVANVEGLNEEIRSIIEVVTADLPEGYITAENASLLERWARTYLMFRKVARKVEREGVVISYLDSQGNENTKENPAFVAYTKLSAVLAQCERQLGFTPTTRSCVLKSLQGKEDDEPVNPFDDLEV